MYEALECVRSSRVLESLRRPRSSTLERSKVQRIGPYTYRSNESRRNCKHKPSCVRATTCAAKSSRNNTTSVCECTRPAMSSPGPKCCRVANSERSTSASSAPRSRVFRGGAQVRCVSVPRPGSLRFGFETLVPRHLYSETMESLKRAARPRHRVRVALDRHKASTHF